MYVYKKVHCVKCNLNVSSKHIVVKATLYKAGPKMFTLFLTV